MVAAPIPTTLRAAKYRRVSTLAQAQHGYSLEAQDKDLDHLAAELGATVVADFEDNDSGAEWDLPGLNALLSAAKRGDFDLLLIYDPDRLARSMAKQLVIEEELTRYGVTIKYVTLRLGDSAEDRLLKNVRASISEYEREKIKLRTMRGKREKAERGQVVGGSSAPYGYRFLLNDKGRACGIEPDPITAPVVRRIFSLLRTHTVERVAMLLNAEGVPTPRGAAGWNPSTIQYMANHPVYCGRWLYRAVSGDSGTHIEVPVPALVDGATWDAAQDALRRRRRVRRARVPLEEDEYLLRGRLTCGFCGGMLVTKQNGQWRYYACLRSTPRGARLARAAECPNSDVFAPSLESHVWHLVTETLLNPDALRAGLAAAHAEHDEAIQQQQARVAILDQEIARQRTRLQKVALQRLDVETGGELDQILLGAAQETERTISSLQLERTRIMANPAPGLSLEQVNALEAFAAQVREGIAAATPSDIRRIYEAIALRGTIRVDPNGIRIGRRLHFTCDWDAYLPLSAANQRVLRSWFT
jgi:site-specific DNA recombinase